MTLLNLILGIILSSMSEEVENHLKLQQIGKMRKQCPEVVGFRRHGIELAPPAHRSARRSFVQLCDEHSLQIRRLMTVHIRNTMMDMDALVNPQRPSNRRAVTQRMVAFPTPVLTPKSNHQLQNLLQVPKIGLANDNKKSPLAARVLKRVARKLGLTPSSFRPGSGAAIVGTAVRRQGDVVAQLSGGTELDGASGFDLGSTRSPAWSEDNPPARDDDIDHPILQDDTEEVLNPWKLHRQMRRMPSEDDGDDGGQDWRKRLGLRGEGEENGDDDKDRAKRAALLTKETEWKKTDILDPETLPIVLPDWESQRVVTQEEFDQLPEGAAEWMRKKKQRSMKDGQEKRGATAMLTFEALGAGGASVANLGSSALNVGATAATAATQQTVEAAAAAAAAAEQTSTTLWQGFADTMTNFSLRVRNVFGPTQPDQEETQPDLEVSVPARQGLAMPS
eukprot:CAMPEP_0175863382 /NCGR_PEP_ID=MMETSP0107_2-20121207/32461_1 /TAXON_ID=195067 ORGANISM="Goniomonas pacifica, Strain CCMP1869" /NCGR_SAMPLE_ID=MMETSP0107_2 /ASSEMBLY_ACC=CAM_ASM_000203 /LENGTH=448 /DNA_ID=CAMNT_0017180469 /DNA_START=113 /DNA_END=1459 /DNA_ORIENTATION=+